MRFCRKNVDRVALFVVVTFGLLLLVSYLPEQTLSLGPLGPYTVKNIDLTSDIVKAQKAAASGALLTRVIDTLVSVEGALEPDTTPGPVPLPTTPPPPRAESSAPSKMEQIDTHNLSLLFEDYSKDGALNRLAQQLKMLEQSKEASLRLAFLGDSFIEADILTADVRNILQSIYGGYGVGFVPIASPVSKVRKSVEHEAEGWETFSMSDYKTADWKRLTLNGFYYLPSEGASVLVRNKKRGKEYTTCQKATLIFVNEKNSTLHVSINGQEPQSITPPSSKRMQTIDFTGDIYSVSFSVTNVEGFYGYGILLNNNGGIYVDNYSMRGSTGIVLSTADKELSADFGRILTPDVIVLQYGLNVASANITNYNYYKVKMVAVIKHLALLFPHSTFVIMGVGDRAVKNGTEFETMPAIPAMVDVQRQIAKAAECIFWDTFAAMGGENSMQAYVSHDPPLANKDYTHITGAGGKKIANAFVYSILKAAETLQEADTVAVEPLPALQSPH